MTTAPVSLPTHVRGGAPATASGAELTHLQRLRWAVRAVLTLGVAASIAANVLHARPNLISQLIAAWPPLALLLTVELISRVPAHRRSLAVLRLLATAAIAGIAAWVSYWHMKGVAARYGETDAAASYLLPISVDGLVVVASISLVEIAGRIRTATAHPAPLMTLMNAAPASTDGPEPGPIPTPTAAPVQRATPASALEVDRGPAALPSVGQTATGQLSVLPRQRVDEAGIPSAATDCGGHVGDGDGSVVTNEQGMPPDDEPAPAGRAPHGQRPDVGPDIGGADEAVPAETPAAVAYWYRRDPSLRPADIAARIGRSERTVRRYWPPAPERRTNGHETNRLGDRLRSA